jgi:hypothetical protein
LHSYVEQAENFIQEAIYSIKKYNEFPNKKIIDPQKQSAQSLQETHGNTH